MDKLPFRQVHLDFHTSEKIQGIAKDWDRKHFQEMLLLGHVSSITVFSKCHHGWSYHPTSVPLGETFPGLGFDLLREQIEAAREIGIQTPIYLSVGLDEKLARKHSEWLVVTPEGGRTWSGWLNAGYHLFCLNTPYLDYIVAQAEEIALNYDGEGIFFDIVGVRDCSCQYCVETLLRRGKDPRDRAARLELGREVYLNYARRINEAVHAINPKMRLFHNGGHITRGDREVADLNTHQELESLPTGGWSYDHFPLSARYVQGLGKEFLGMTGKFHTTWGEFGGFKHPNALRYETALSLANGAKVSIGDQMHPYGRLDRATYALIGKAYAEVKAKEEWCSNVTSIADVGVLSLEACLSIGTHPGAASTPGGLVDAGVVRMLQEGKFLFDVIDTESSFDKYKVLVLPDAIPPDSGLAGKLDAFLASGGKLLVTGDSLLDENAKRFTVDLGVRYSGHTEYDPEYIYPCFRLKDWENTGFVVYSRAVDIEVDDAEVMAVRQDPFFNRDFMHFCSHQHAPSQGFAAGPAMVKTPNTVYIAFPVFKLYAEKGQNVLREIVLQGLRELLTEPTLTTSLPAQGIQTAMAQKISNGGTRTVIHIMYASPVKRGSVEVIEDLVPIYETTIQIRTSSEPKRIYLAPQGRDLSFTYSGGVASCTVPVFECHQMIVVE